MCFRLEFSFKNELKCSLNIGRTMAPHCGETTVLHLMRYTFVKRDSVWVNKISLKELKQERNILPQL